MNDAFGNGKYVIRVHQGEGESAGSFYVEEDFVIHLRTQSSHCEVWAWLPLLRLCFFHLVSCSPFSFPYILFKENLLPW